MQVNDSGELVDTDNGDNAMDMAVSDERQAAWDAEMESLRT